MTPRGLLATVSVALPLYGVAVALLAADFLPSSGQVVYDCRWMVCGNQDKLDELAAAGSHELGALEALVRGHLAGDPPPRHEVNFNPLPVLAVTAASAVVPPVAAYNAVLLAAWVGAGLAMCLAVVAIARSPGAGLVAGWLYLLAPMTVQIQHCRSLDYGLLLLLPLFLLALARAGRGGGWLASAALGLALLGLWATNQYYAVAATGVAAAWTALALATPVGGEGWRDRVRSTLRLAAAVAGASALVAPWLFVEASALAARQGGDVALGIGEEMGGRAADQLAGWLHPRRPWTVPTLLLAAVGAVGAPRAARPVALALAGIALAGGVACALLLALDRPLVDAMRASPVAWRMREVHMMAAVPLSALALLAGLGWATVGRRARTAVPVAALLLASLALCLALPVDGRAWWREVRAGGRSVEVPQGIVDGLDALAPAPMLLVVDAADLDLGASLQVALAQRTELERPSQELDHRLELLLGEQAPDPVGLAAATAAELDGGCVAALVRAAAPGDGAPPQVLSTLAQLGVDTPVVSHGDWTLLSNRRCPGEGAAGHPTGSGDPP